MIETNLFIFIMDIIGVISFAISASLLAIKKEMDIFGVIILAITTSVGGGVIRDLVIGQIPPVMFTNSIYVIMAAVLAIVVFICAYIHQRNGHHFSPAAIKFYEKAMFWCDTLGLAAFTIDGVHTGLRSEFSTNLFLIVFLGFITGVGGGILRDLLAMDMPYIFIKHVYACAVLIGALAMALLDLYGANETVSSLIAFALILIIRALAAHFQWNLPRIKQSSKL